MRGRLAPSPTGAQHLGNAKTFLMAWLSARMQAGTLIFRMEDLDSPRVKSWAIQQAMDDLKWLGLEWDFDWTHPGSLPPLIQTQRLDRYQKIMEELKHRELVYPCICSRKEIEESASAPHEMHLDGPIYPGTCRHYRVLDAERFSSQGTPYAWRYRMAPGVVTWHDGVLGVQTLDAEASLGDFVVGRSSGVPAYQLAVVVDDHDMHVTEVVRGADLVYSTYRQLAIYRDLAWQPPNFYHLPLVVGVDGKRLAKRHGDTRLAAFRDAGVRPETIIGFLAWKSGLIANWELLTPHQLQLRMTGSIADYWKPMKTLVFQENEAIPYFLQRQAAPTRFDQA